MKRTFLPALALLCSGLSSCAAAPDNRSTVLCDSDDLYICYPEVLEQVLPMELFVDADIVFRRYDTYASADNPTEYVASLDLVFRNGQQVIEASYRRLLDDNLFMQLAGATPAESADAGLAASIEWTSGKSTSDECGAIADIWERARRLELTALSQIPRFDVSGGNPEVIVLRIHPAIYEVSFTLLDETITISQTGGSTALSDWVTESISVLESCSAQP